MVGASIGFLWYNAHPAEVFMGDVGSLALGGAIGTVAVIIKQELLLPFIGGIFVLEAISVILQVGSYKLRKKRIFKMAPLHHHFELMGWSESKVIVALLDRRVGVCALRAHHAEAALSLFLALPASLTFLHVNCRAATKRCNDPREEDDREVTRA